MLSIVLHGRFPLLLIILLLPGLMRLPSIYLSFVWWFTI